MCAVDGDTAYSLKQRTPSRYAGLHRSPFPSARHPESNKILQIITNTHIAPGQVPSLFFGLPRDVRHKIYEYVYSSCAMCIGSGAPGLLLVCKQICLESIDDLYANACFYVDCMTSLARWLDMLPEKHRNAICEIRCNGLGSERPGWMRAPRRNGSEPHSRFYSIKYLLSRRARLELHPYVLKVRKGIGDGSTLWTSEPAQIDYCAGLVCKSSVLLTTFSF